MHRIALLLLLLVSHLAFGEEFTAKVVAVLDGDTVLVKRARGLVKVRMAGIDAPEKGQPFGESSKRSLSVLVKGKQITVKSQAIDQYGRMVASISLNGLDVDAEQIRRGMAWAGMRSNKVMRTLQEEAKRAPRGLWALSNPVPPWDWRKQHPSIAPMIGVAAADIKPTASFDPSCGTKKHCSEMTSCEEAKFYLASCGAKLLDGDADGIPCEKLCVPANSKAN
ncbi:MAG: thermonuclease family protein [Gallionella sp.]|nr:nuclease (SNase) [Gallionella sp.]